MTKTVSSILKKEFEFSYKHIGLSFSEDFWLKDEYRITINGQTFEYFRGIGYREPISRYRKNEAKKWLNFNAHKEVESYNYLVKMLNTNTKPKSLEIDDILASLILDADCGQMSFTDFCDNFGYDNDSIKHLNMYFECEKTYNKVRKIGINLSQAVESFQDY